MSMRIEIMEKHWRLVAKNGRVLAHSEQYDTDSNARRAGKRMSRLLRLPWRQK